jgi:DNA-binding NtrC family response regulator
MELVADRFVIRDDGYAYDLATGERVTLAVSSAGGISEQARWIDRCRWLTSVHHRLIAPLVDYGMAGETRRFEAWRSGTPWMGARELGDRTIALVSQFLTACGLTTGDLSRTHLRHLNSRIVVLPQPDTGYELQTSTPPAGDLPLHAGGISIIARRGVSALVEAITEMSGPPRVLGLWGPQGAGVGTAVLELSRVARANGFVPVSSHHLNRQAYRLVSDRSLFVIETGERTQGLLRLMACTARSPRPHVLLCISTQEPANVDGVGLEPLSAEALVSAVLPRSIVTFSRRRLEDAARRASGLPGRFANLLWGKPQAAHAWAPRATVSTAAEQAAVYGESSPTELATVRRRVDVAVHLLARGRHAAGDRALRAAAGSLARRHDWSHAALSLLALAASLLKRGRAADAQAVLKNAREYLERLGSGGIGIDAAILSGVALTDMARLEEAENVLTATVNASRTAREEVRTAAGQTALARCLFWRGRYDEADRLLASIDTANLPLPDRVRMATGASRAAVGCRDAAAAVAHAARALEIAERAARPELVAQAACAAAFAHLSVGDSAAVERDTGLAVRAARAAHDPLRALRARLIATESVRRHSRHRAAPVLLARIRRLVPVVPEILRARCRLLVDLCSSASSPDDIVKRHVSTTGLEALKLLSVRSDDLPARSSAVVEDVLDILRFCQTVEEDGRALREICARLRARLRAAAVGVFVPERGGLGLLMSDGYRIENQIAGRVMDARQAIPPHQWNGGIEAGAPVQYGGDTLAVLAGRWTLGSAPDHQRASIILATAAVVSGPVVAAVLSRRASQSTSQDDDLLGISPLIAEIRRAVERAAAAPFAVLVAGESGCGKELVARALHRRSPRRSGPFCTLNCAALPDELVEAELFGHTRGAFTGAASERVGVFEEANAGTLFLDEIGELSPRAQAKILRTIQEGELRRVGENVPRRVDVRIVTATNRDLRHEVAAGRFRQDLLYRLDVVRISVPPLRDRREDIAVLAEHFWRELTMRIGSRATLGTATIAALSRYDWPGNVRELQNVLASLAVRSPKRGSVPPDALPPPIGSSPPLEAWRLDDARRAFEEHFVRAALVRTGGHRARTAQELGLTRQGLAKILVRLRISDANEKSSVVP